MIYCLGDPRLYAHILKDSPVIWKAGRKIGGEFPYPGCEVWQFKDDAELCLLEYPDQKVYGVMASWFTDTAPCHDDNLPGARYLLFDSLVVGLD